MKIFTFKFCFLVSIFSLFLVSNSNATTYYSNSAAPNSTANWWTGTAGTGSHPSNFTTSGDIFILQSGQTCNTTNNLTIGAGVTLRIDGTLGINGNGDQVVIDGTVIFTNTSATQVTMAGAGSGNDFIINAGGTLITANVNGIKGTNCSLPVDATKRTTTLSTTGKYEFNGATNQTTVGLPTLASTGTLTISNTSGAIVTFDKAYSFPTGVTTTVNVSSILATGAFAFTNAGTTTISGSLQIDASGSIANTPTYSGTSSKLIYNSSFTTGPEWNSTSATVGAGVPHSVTVQNNSTLTTAANRALTGTLTVASGSTIILGAGYTAGASSIAGTLQLNSGGSVTPTITYSGAASKLIYNASFSTGAAWNSTSATVGAGVPNSVTVQNNSTLTTAANRALTGTLTVASGSTIILGAGYTSGSGTSAISGTLQLNSGGSVTSAPTYVGTSSALIYNSTFSVGAEWNSTSATVGVGVPQNVTVQNNSTVTTSANRALTGTLTVASGSKIALGAGYTSGSSAISGSLQLNSGGSVTSAPTYVGTASALVYNSTFSVGAEWNSTSATVGVGVPQNVTIQNNSTVTTSANRALTGTLTVASGSKIALGAGYTSGSSAISGSLQLNSGGSVTSAPTYVGTASALVYNSTFSVGAEWNSTSATVGAGVPQNVTVQNNSILTTAANRALTGTLTVASGSTIILGAGYTAGSSSIAGTLQINSGGSVTPTITYSGAASKLVYNASFSTGAEWNSTSATVGAGVPNSVTVQNNGTLTTAANRALTGTLTVANGSSIILGAAYTAGSSSIAGTLQINSGGSVTPTITYSGTSSALVYNSGGSFSTSGEWNNNGTTAGAGIPHNVTIQNSTTLNMPTTNRGLAGNLNISSGTLVLNATSGDLYVGGNWDRTSSGTFTSNNRIVFLNGSSAATIKAPESSSKDANGSFGGETFPYLVINKSAKANTVKILSNVAITKTLTLTTGTLDMDTSDVVLVSKSTGTADLAAVNTSNADITYTSTGRFIPQRYIGNTSTVRTWRFLTAPLQASDPLTINDAWQEGQVNPNVSTPNATNPWPGYGTHITGPGSVYDATKGFDQGTGNNGYSIEYFDNTTGTTKLSYPANTKSTALMSQLGWQIFIRGDRSFVIGTQATPSSNVTLEPKGKINIGTVTSTIVANRTNVVGNPYPCQINMTGVSIGGFTQQDFKLWDPKAYSNYSNTGKYIFFNWNGGGYDVNNGPTTIWLYPGTVESSEAFLTYNTVPGTSVVFHESDKVAGTSTLNGIQSRPVAGNRPTGNPFAKFQADLQFYDNTNQVFNNISGANIYFNPGFNSTVIAGEDNISPVGSATGELRIQKNGFQLSTDREPLLSTDDTVRLYLSTLNHSKHRLVLSTKYFTPNATAELIDQYLNTTTPLLISDTDSVLYEFDINDNAANRSDRFLIAFRPIISLPVKFNNVKATQQQSSIAVEWQIENEINVKNYEVERSADGVHFTKIADKNAINSSTTAIYNLLDASPNAGENYYRIRLINKSGAITYSEIIKVTIGNKENSISIVNNPIANNTINLQFNNQQPGIYKVRLFNQSGQTIESKEISGTGSSWSESFLVRSSLSKGIYNLEILTPANKKLIEKVVVQ